MVVTVLPSRRCGMAKVTTCLYPLLRFSDSRETSSMWKRSKRSLVSSTFLKSDECERWLSSPPHWSLQSKSRIRIGFLNLPRWLRVGDRHGAQSETDSGWQRSRWIDRSRRCCGRVHLVLVLFAFLDLFFFFLYSSLDRNQNLCGENTTIKSSIGSCTTDHTIPSYKVFWFVRKEDVHW